MTIETIFALSSGIGRAGIAVLRLSGPAVRTVLVGMIGRVPEPRRAMLARFKDPASGEVLDHGLVLFFPAPASETGEDCAEFHCHGGPAIVAAMLRAFAQLCATRLAEPGEFARRAFENGKLDLDRSRGLGRSRRGRDGSAAASSAATDARASWAVKRMPGERLCSPPRRSSKPRSILATRPMCRGLARQRCSRPSSWRSSPNCERSSLPARPAKGCAKGSTVVIAGPPNAGKSTLLNALARRDVAIVSAIPGTTRDAIEVHLDLSGLPLTLIDTAGLRESEDPIEAIGIARTSAKAASADLILWLSEAAAPAPPSLAAAAEIWPVFTKLDLYGAERTAQQAEFGSAPRAARIWIF